MKIALITGASSGIGKATAEAFAQKNIDLILCGRRIEALKELAKALNKEVKTRILVFDVRKRQEVFDAIESLPNEWKQIDYLINNAGNAHGRATIQDGDIDDFDAMIDGNVKGLLYVSKAIIPAMIARNSGHIVNISSIAGKETYAQGAVYCASKAAVEAISQGMRMDLLPHGIKVSNIAPGAVETGFSAVRFKGDIEKANAIYAGFTPLVAEDIADAIVYAISVPDHVTIADVTIFPKAQGAATLLHRG